MNWTDIRKILKDVPNVSLFAEIFWDGSLACEIQEIFVGKG